MFKWNVGNKSKVLVKLHSRPILICFGSIFDLRRVNRNCSDTCKILIQDRSIFALEQKIFWFSMGYMFFCATLFYIISVMHEKKHCQIFIVHQIWTCKAFFPSISQYYWNYDIVQFFFSIPRALIIFYETFVGDSIGTNPKSYNNFEQMWTFEFECTW